MSKKKNKETRVLQTKQKKKKKEETTHDSRLVPLIPTRPTALSFSPPPSASLSAARTSSLARHTSSGKPPPPRIPPPPPSQTRFDRSGTPIPDRTHCLSHLESRSKNKATNNEHKEKTTKRYQGEAAVAKSCYIVVDFFAPPFFCRWGVFLSDRRIEHKSGERQGGQGSLGTCGPSPF